MINKKVVSFLLKGICLLITITAIFFCLQAVFLPKFPRESTAIIKGFSHLEKNSVDVLFMGASQMFSTIDAKRLTEEYGINSYDYGASRQMISTTEYYLDEALKTQHPKLVMIESCEILHELSDDIRDEVIAYSYPSMPLSGEKFNYLLRDSGQDMIKTFEICYLPLLAYHNKWKSLQVKDVSETVFFDHYADYSLRGFNPREGCNPQKMAFYDEQSVESVMPDDNARVILSISNKCKAEGIRLIFFKTPSANWTKADSECTKRFMSEHDIEFFDLHDHLDEIDIDQDTDFVDIYHLNQGAAEKCTDFLRDYLEFEVFYGI